MSGSGEKLFKISLKKARFKGRLNRFTVAAEASTGPALLHLTNTGRLRELLKPGAEILYVEGRGVKTSGRVVGVAAGGAAALIDTLTQRHAFEHAYQRGLIQWLEDCEMVVREPVVMNSRIDYLMKCCEDKLYLELKSAVFLSEDGAAMYPDTVSLRGRRHLELLTQLSRRHRAAVVFVAAHPSARYFTPCDLGDPVVRPLLLRAVDAGVVVRAVKTYLDLEGWVVWDGSDLPVVLGR